jgi:glycosyltransferase involved in cell wall biosynthesis
MSRLQVLVNHYNEDRTVVRRLLSSLMLQTDVDFEVLIMSDGGDVRLGEDALSGYPFAIRYAYAPHSGVCHTRNVLLDSSDAEYLMFCDADDCFSGDGLRLLVEAAEGGDVACAPFLSELPDGSTKPVTNDTLHLHAKVFRRQYLIDNDIRFPDEMEYSGDMAFLWLALSLTNRVRWVSESFYTWKWNASSITRSNPYFHVAAYGNTTTCYTLLGRELRRRGEGRLLSNLVCTMFAMIYSDISGKRWSTYPIDLVRKANECATACLAEFWDVYAAADNSVRLSGYRTMSEFLGGGIGRFEDMERRLASLMGRRRVLVIGNGVVGGNLAREIHPLNPVIYDKYKGIDERVAGVRYSVAFVCVDTPRTKESACDTSEVVNAITENDADVFVIKSTVPVGDTDRIRGMTGKTVVFSPEYYGGTQHCNNFRFDFTVLGGDRTACASVQQLLQDVYDARHRFVITDSATAELAKYMENCWLATKVAFCDQFFDIAEQLGVEYEELREIFILDPRVNPSHTFVYRDHPWWSSHCLDKDVPALSAMAHAPLIDAVIDANEDMKRRYGS